MHFGIQRREASRLTVPVAVSHSVSDRVGTGDLSILLVLTVFLLCVCYNVVPKSSYVETTM